jgi:hypothetical protein
MSDSFRGCRDQPPLPRDHHRYSGRTVLWYAGRRGAGLLCHVRLRPPGLAADFGDAPSAAIPAQ